MLKICGETSLITYLKVLRNVKFVLQHRSLFNAMVLYSHIQPSPGWPEAPHHMYGSLLVLGKAASKSSQLKSF